MIRTDRVLTLLFDKLRRVVNRSEGPKVPVLMYHSISKTSLVGKSPYFQTHTSPEIFLLHIKLLQKLDYKIIDLVEVLSPSLFNVHTGPDLVVLTFDDGYQDFYEQAFPVLQEHGCAATVFISTAFVGKVPDLFMGKSCLDWKQIRRMSNDGISIGSHTVNHRILYGMKFDQIEYELKISKEEIEQQTGKPVKAFSYPYAFPEGDRYFNNRYVELLMKCGYAIGVTTRIGRLKGLHENFVVPRLPVNIFDDRKLFEAKLSGSYDWLRHPQKIKKILKKCLSR